MKEFDPFYLPSRLRKKGEIWAKVPNEFLAVSTHGRMWSFRYHKFNKGSVTDNGYITDCLSAEPGIPRRTILRHRTIAQVFIENPNDFPFVFHVDGDLQNNRVDNLVYGTSKDGLPKSKQEFRGTLARQLP